MRKLEFSSQRNINSFRNCKRRQRDGLHRPSLTRVSVALCIRYNKAEPKCSDVTAAVGFGLRSQITYAYVCITYVCMQKFSSRERFHANG
jgi:hypothetical protein